MRGEWRLTTLGDACQIRPPKKESKKRLTDKDEVSFVPMGDLGIREKKLTASQTRLFGDVYSGYTYFADGDVLLAKITPCFQNGKLSIAGGLRNGVGFGSSEFFVFRCLDELTPEFLFYFLSQERFFETGVTQMSGAVGHQRVPLEFIRTYPLSLPPHPEQKRIVAILDEAFAAIETATANAEKNLANARELFESQLKEGFEYHTGSWGERQLGDVCENLDSKRVPITKSKRKPGYIPYYGASGAVDHVADYLFDDDLLLVSEDGANLLARTYPIAFSISGKSWVNNHAHVLRFEAMFQQRLVEYYLNSIDLKPYVSGMAQPKLNQRALNSIPVPWSDVLSDVGAVVDSLDAAARTSDELSKLYEQRLDALSELKQSILHKAFTGELTADPKAADRTVAKAAV